MSDRFPILAKNDHRVRYVFVARLSQALAQGSSGTAYVAVMQHKSEKGGQGAYQLPKDPEDPNYPNVWRTYEFPALQRNSAVTSVISVAQNENWEPSRDWTKDGGQEKLPFADADKLPVPEPVQPIPVVIEQSRRGMYAMDYEHDAPSFHDPTLVWSGKWAKERASEDL